MIEEADLIAIRRAHIAGGEDGALAEIKRRFPSLSANSLPNLLAMVLRMPINMPPDYDEQGRPVLDHRRRAMRPRR